MAQNLNIITKENKLFGQVRFTIIDGKEYAVGIDVAAALGYKDASGTISKKCKNGIKQLINVGCQNGNSHNKARNTQEISLIPESDIYRLIFGSKLESAEKFQDWVFNEVLPSIRKHGMYAADELLNNPDLLIQVATKLKEEKEARIKAEKEKQALAERNIELLDANNTQKEIIEELQPKADYADIVLNSPELVSVTQISKDYGMSAIAFNKLLKELGIQFKRGGQWFLKAEYQDLGWTQSCTYVLDDGEATHNTTKWTQKGRLGLYNFLKEMDIVPLIERTDIE